MAEKYIKDLTAKSVPSSTDLFVMDNGSGSGSKINYDQLADAVLNKLTSKTFANQVGGSSAATLLAQLATLNSNLTGETGWSNATGEHGGHIYYRKRAGFCCVLLIGSFNDMTSSAYNIVGQLPNGYKPNTSIPFVCHATGGTQEYFGRVLDTGEISVYSPTTGTAFANASVVFPVG